jgi:hypothetical protein
MAICGIITALHSNYQGMNIQKYSTSPFSQTAGVKICATKVDTLDTLKKQDDSCHGKQA